MKKVKRIASFTLFSNDFKSKLTTAYPFLPADQIQLKLRQKWKKLSPREKEPYYKDVLCSVENVIGTKKKTGKQTKSQRKTPRKDENVDLEELTIFDDDLKLKYVNVSKKYSPDDAFDINKDDKFYEDFKRSPKKSLKTYKGSRNNIEQPIPMVIDETPFGQQGILKKSSSDKAKKRKVQFDFSKDHEQLCDDDYCRLSSDEEIKMQETPIKTLKNEGKTQILNCGSNRDHSQSHADAIKNATLENNEIKPNLDLCNKDEPLTPELQRTNSPMIIEKMCEAPKKKAVKGNYTSIEKITNSGKKMTKALSVANLNKLIPTRKPTVQSNHLSGSSSDDDDLQFEKKELKTIFSDIGKRNTNIGDLKMFDTTPANPHRLDDVSRSPSPFSDCDVSLNDSDDNIDTSIGWELSDVLSSNKNSSSIENTIQLLKNSVSSSLTSIIRESPDHLVSDCSSPLSGFSEFSDAELDMPSLSNDEMMSNEFVSDEKLHSTVGLTPCGDFDIESKIHDKTKNKDPNRSKSLLCDLFDEKNSVLTRILPPPGNAGENIAPTIFEEGSIFA